MLTDNSVKLIELHMAELESAVADSDMKAALGASVSLIGQLDNSSSDWSRANEPDSAVGARASIRTMMRKILKWDGNRSLTHTVRTAITRAKRSINRVIKDTEHLR